MLLRTNPRRIHSPFLNLSSSLGPAPKRNARKPMSQKKKKNPVLNNTTDCPVTLMHFDHNAQHMLHELELPNAFSSTIAMYPRTFAVAVRAHTVSL